MCATGREQTLLRLSSFPYGCAGIHLLAGAGICQSTTALQARNVDPQANTSCWDRHGVDRPVKVYFLNYPGTWGNFGPYLSCRWQQRHRQPSPQPQAGAVSKAAASRGSSSPRLWSRDYRASRKRAGPLLCSSIFCGHSCTFKPLLDLLLLRLSVMFEPLQVQSCKTHLLRKLSEKQALCLGPCPLGHLCPFLPKSCTHRGL